MNKHDIFEFKNRDTNSDALTEMLRTGGIIRIVDFIPCSKKPELRFNDSFGVVVKDDFTRSILAISNVEYVA